MNFKEYLTESSWNKKKAIDFIAMMEPIFLKCNIQVEIVGGVAKIGESENDLDLKVKPIKNSKDALSKAWGKLIGELKKHPDIAKMDVQEQDMNYGSVITILLKPDRRVVDIFFGYE